MPLSSVPSEYVARRTFIPVDTWSGSGSTLIRLPRTGVPSQSTMADTNGTGMPGAANATIVNVLTVPSVATVDLLELGAEARGAGVAAVEVAGAARGALVGHEVRLVAEHEVVDERDLFTHRGSTYRAARRPGRIEAVSYSRRRWRTAGCTTSGSGRADLPDGTSIALLSGDPGRSELIATEHLTDGRPLARNRGLDSFVARLPGGAPVVCATSGMGAPSMSIVVNELVQVGDRAR